MLDLVAFALDLLNDWNWISGRAFVDLERTGAIKSDDNGQSYYVGRAHIVGIGPGRGLYHWTWEIER